MVAKISGFTVYSNAVQKYVCTFMRDINVYVKKNIQRIYIKMILIILNRLIDSTFALFNLFCYVTIIYIY